MADDRMFSQLMATSRPSRVSSATSFPAKRKIRHLSLNLPADQAEIVDRYFSLLYPTELRMTRSAIIGVAIEILDRILQGSTPEALDSSLLDAYARTRADAQEGVRARTRARVP